MIPQRITGAVFSNSSNFTTTTDDIWTYALTAYSLTTDPKSLFGVSQGNPAVVTVSTDHEFSTGDEVFFADVGGMTELNGDGDTRGPRGRDFLRGLLPLLLPPLLLLLLLLPLAGGAEFPFPPLLPPPLLPPPGRGDGLWDRHTISVAL
jgi:hypothetical protein